jgi:D-sedoheptulose 7-phosphate isomerase
MVFINMKIKSKEYIHSLIKRYPKLSSLKSDIFNSINVLLESITNNGKILICGNGGSSSDADHIVGELMKSFNIKRKIDDNFKAKLENLYGDESKYFSMYLQKSIRAISLSSHSAFNTAFINDSKPDLIFAQQVMGYGKKDDVLLAISTSGNSKNVINAAKIAKAIDMKVISLTGNNGGELKEYSDFSIIVNEFETYKIQEYHLPIYHSICLSIENELFGE